MLPVAAVRIGQHDSGDVHGLRRVGERPAGRPLGLCQGVRHIRRRGGGRLRLGGEGRTRHQTAALAGAVSETGPFYRRTSLPTVVLLSRDSSWAAFEVDSADWTCCSPAKMGIRGILGKDPRLLCHLSASSQADSVPSGGSSSPPTLSSTPSDCPSDSAWGWCRSCI